MKKIVIILILGISFLSIKAQDGEFNLTIHPDTVGVGQMLEIGFTIKNMDGEILAQKWDESLLTYSPSVSNRTSIINGLMTQSKEYKYSVQATKEGTFMITVQLKLHDSDEIITRKGQVVVVKERLQPKEDPQPKQDLQFKRRDRNELPEQSIKKKRKIYRL